MADELFNLDDDDQDDPSSNPNFEQVRSQARDLSKALRAEKKARAEAEAKVATYELQRRSESAQRAFSGMGLPAKAADLFLRVNPDGDVTDEAVKNFVAEYDFLKPPPPQAAEEEGEEGAEPPTGESGYPVVDGVELDTGTAPDLQARLAARGVTPDFVPVAGAPTEGKKISVAEFQKIYAKEGIKAMRLVREGRVDLPDGEQANI